MKTRPKPRRFASLRAAGALAALALLGVLESCGGGGDDAATPAATAAPLVWDDAQATWDNVTWQ